MRKCLRIAAMFLMSTVAQAAIAQDVGPCQEAKQYSPPEPGLHVEVPPLVVRRVFGRAVIEGDGKLISGYKVTPACVSLFTEESHRFVASVPLDKSRRFTFRGVVPGKYRLVARSPGLCTGNTSIEVTPLRAGRGKNGIVVHFRVRAIDDCTYADYGSKGTTKTTSR